MPTEMTLRREMGLTYSDFFRSLSQLPGGWVHETYSDGATLKYADGTIQISLGPQCERRLTALVKIPFIQVIFKYVDLSEVERKRFQSRFDLTFQRGGG
jgi:hypothetical protein